MDEVTVRLPAASPALHRRYLRWIEDVMEYFQARSAEEGEPGSSPASPITANGLRHLAPNQLAELKLQVEEAERVGLTEIEPLLTGVVIEWRQALAYGKRVGEWLRAMADSGTQPPRLDTELQDLRAGIRRSVEAALERNSLLLDVIPGDEPGTFRLIGELDMTYADALTATLESELSFGHRLTLDLSELNFMDSTGIRLLISLARKAQSAELLPIVLLSPARGVRHILDVAVPSGIPGVDVRDGA